MKVVSKMLLCPMVILHEYERMRLLLTKWRLSWEQKQVLLTR